MVWLCSECGWQLESAVEHLRSITALACGNPYLIDAVAKFLEVQVDIPLNQAGDQGHWICISPPGSPVTSFREPEEEKEPVQLVRDLPEEEESDLVGLFEGI